MEEPGLDQTELALLGHCVEDYCASGELFWALQRLNPSLTNRSVVLRRGLDVLERLLTEHLISAYVKSADAAQPFVAAEGNVAAVLAVVEREHLVGPNTVPGPRYYFAATTDGSTRYFGAQEPPA